MSAELLRSVLARDGIFNVRDLGGHAIVGGGSTQFSRVLRGDSLHRARGSAAALVDFGVVRVLDLRDMSERDRSGSFSAEGVEVMHLPVLDPTFSWEQGDLDDTTTLLGHRYRVILTEFGDRIAAAIEAVAQVVSSGDGSVVAFHCAAGKDRTGLLAALLLSTVGVDRGAVVADYVRTANSTAVQTTWLRYMGFGDVSEQELETGVWSARPETMEHTLDWLDTTYGGADAYLRSAGVAATSIEALRAALAA